MAGELINKKRISGTVSFKNYDRLQKVSNETMIPRTCIIEKGLEMVLELYEKQLKSNKNII